MYFKPILYPFINIRPLNGITDNVFQSVGNHRQKKPLRPTGHVPRSENPKSQRDTTTSDLLFLPTKYQLSLVVESLRT